MKNKESNKNDTFINQLVSFGLSENEAKVYVFLLERGENLGGSKIALGTKIHRQYFYNSLPKLLNLGLVIEVKVGKQSKYRAAPPTQLEKIAKQNVIEAENIAESLKDISKLGYEQDFEVFVGEKAIVRYEMEYARKVTNKNNEYIIGGATSKFAELMGEHLDDYLGLKRRAGSNVKYLGTIDEKIYYQKYIGLYNNQEYRFLKNLPNGISHMVIRDEVVSFYTFVNPELLYIIKSEEVAENYRKFFMMLWDMAEE